MSHYRVAVFYHEGDDISRLLAPYSENDKSLFIFEPVAKEKLAENWEKFKAENPSWKYNDWIDEFYSWDPESGDYGHRYNPNARWDWWSKMYIEDLFELKDPDAEYKEQILKSEVDFFAVPEEIKEAGEKALAKEWKMFSTEGDGYYSEKYYLERYGDQETYIRERMRPMMPYAFITPDGVWHAPGIVGWFGMSDETADSAERYWNEWREFIEHGEDCYVTLVDCHI